MTPTRLAVKEGMLSVGTPLAPQISFIAVEYFSAARIVMLLG